MRQLAPAVWPGGWSGMLLCFVIVWGQHASGQDTGSLNPSSYPDQLIVLENSLYFVADDGIHGREIWRYTPEDDLNKAAECSLVTDLMPGQGSSNPERFLAAGNCLYFSAVGPRIDRWPWVLRKNETQPAAVTEATDTFLVDPQFMDQDARNVYMAAATSATSRFLYRIPRGSATAERVAEFGPNRLSEAQRTTIGPDGSFYYYLGGHLIRLSEGQLVDLADFGGATDLFLSGAIAPLRDCIILVGFDDGHGREVWRSDGTRESTRLMKDIADGPGSSRITSFTLWRDELYFGADDGRCGKELWKTDGTTEGTKLLRDHLEGPSHGDPHYFAAAENWLFYLAHDENHGKELWRTDGSPENTVLVADLKPGPLGSDPWQLTPFNGLLFFCADSAEYGEEIFVSDGNADGTHILKDIVPGEGDSGPDNLAVLGNRLFFTCDDGIHGEELWVTDGTAEGTRLAADIYPIRMNPSSSPHNLVAVGERVFFTVYHQMTGEELWVSDGTSDGTRLVRDIAPGPLDSAPSSLTVSGNRVFFAARTQTNGCELWFSDGTLDGTQLACDINEGPEGSNPRCLCPDGESLLLVADDGKSGEALWRYSLATSSANGPAHPGEAGAQIADVFRLFNNVYAYVIDKNGHANLCRIEDNPDGLALIVQNDAVSALNIPEEISVAATPVSGAVPPELSEAGLVGLVHPLGAQETDRTTLPLGEVLLCVLDVPGHGAELFSVRCDPRSLQLVRDIFPGPASSSPASLCEAGGLAYFTAEHPTEGRILWKSDGKAEGTGVVMGQVELILSFTIPAYEVAALDDTLVVVSEAGRSSPREHKDIELRFIPLAEAIEEDRIFSICVGKQGSWPRQLTRAGNHIFFTANDGIHGEELWITDGTQEGTRLVKDILTPGDLSPLTP